MAEIDEKLQKLLERLEKQVSEISDRASLPKIEKDEIDKIEQYVAQIEASTASIDDLATSQEDYSRLVSESVAKLKDKYKDQYDFLTEQEKNLQVRINIRAAKAIEDTENLKKKQLEVNDSIKMQADAFDNLIEKQKDLGKFIANLELTS